jgi:mono/diheme cytochrome c family protein
MQNRKLIFVVLALLVTAFALVITSAAQNANSSKTVNRNSETRDIAPPAAQQDFSKNTWELPDDAEKTRNSVASSPESVAKGKELYLERTKGNCVFCHGENGAGNEANLPKLRRKPADISNKERMTAMTDGELFWKISKGINGIMPAGEKRLTEEERWNVVNYIRTLAKEAK